MLGVAPILGLDRRALCELAKGEWRPENSEELNGLAQFNTDYHGMAVNSYLVWDPAGHVAAVFDTGADCSDMVRFAKRHKLNVQLILLTHAHPDHVADLPRLREETGADVFTPAREPVPGAEPVGGGKEISAWKSPNRYATDLWPFPGRDHVRGDRACTPDRDCGRFNPAGSMGGGNVSYRDALKNNLE